MTTNHRASLAAFIAVALACVVAFHIPLNYSPTHPVPHLPRPSWHLIAGAELLPSQVVVAGSSLAHAVKKDVSRPSEPPVATASSGDAGSAVVETAAVEAHAGGTTGAGTTKHQQAHTNPPQKPPSKHPHTKHPHTKNPHTKNPPGSPVPTPPVTTPTPPTGTGTGGTGSGTGSGTGTGGSGGAGSGDGNGGGYGGGQPSLAHPATYPIVYPGQDSGYYSGYYSGYSGYGSSAYAARMRFGSWPSRTHGSTDRSRAPRPWYDAAHGHHAATGTRHGCGTGDGAHTVGRHARR